MESASFDRNRRRPTVRGAVGSRVGKGFAPGKHWSVPCAQPGGCDYVYGHRSHPNPVKPASSARWRNDSVTYPYLPASLAGRSGRLSRSAPRPSPALRAQAGQRPWAGTRSSGRLGGWPIRRSAPRVVGRSPPPRAEAAAAAAPRERCVPAPGTRSHDPSGGRRLGDRPRRRAALLLAGERPPLRQVHLDRDALHRLRAGRVHRAQAGAA